MPLSTIQILGLLDLNQALTKVPREWAKVEREALKTIADEAARRSKAKAGDLGGVHARAARGISGRATGGAATVTTSGGRSTPMALVGIYGAKRKTGWYARGPYASSSSPQHPPWVGNAWDVAVRGQGPYGVNDALAEYLPEILDEFSDAFDDATSGAFPI